MSNALPDRDAPRATVAQALATIFWELGVRLAYGVCGREIVPLWEALRASGFTPREIVTMHSRHESGAGFAAIASWAFSGRPTVLFVTTGPGLTNAITSLEAARAAGAKLVLLSPTTPPSDIWRLGIQSTGFPSGIRFAEIHGEGRIFDFVATLESPDDLHAIAGQLASGLGGPGPYLAHIAVPMALQETPLSSEVLVPRHSETSVGVSAEVADDIVALLWAEPFVVWVGYGARHHAAKIHRLLELTGAPAMSSPRGLGTVDTHRQFIGITGNGGHLPSLITALERYAPARVLVLGTGLGAATSSGWRPELVPADGLIHCDLDRSVFCRAYPAAPTVKVQADVGALLDAILARSDRLVRREVHAPPEAPRSLTLVPDRGGFVHPAALMAAIQRVIVDGTDVPVLADPSSCMFWAARHLVFDQPGRWFVENRVGAVGSGAAAVVGAAVAVGGPAFVITGDHGLLMHNEINAAVHYGVHAIWCVVNNSGMAIVRDGMKADGMDDHDADFPTTDFAAFARAQGADGIRVSREEQLDAALQMALAADGPFVIDVMVNDAPAPIESRTRSGQ